VRANVAQLDLYASGAERALVAADTRLGGLWRQILVAVLAVGTDLQRHTGLPPLTVSSNLADRSDGENDKEPFFSATRLPGCLPGGGTSSSLRSKWGKVVLGERDRRYFR